ncbi:MAG: exopolysaccharide biosynthesis protein [Alphaproteobacteria bacterium]|nr:exopolysaccharide biosynthesis protein [Alphaproteobacteria bacterium]MCW5743991.1 exopolysaccharide biosynthesis protein [Alphaproteobacteria bacterium]
MVRADAYVPTSEVLDDLFARAPDEVTVDWLIDNLHERSFGIVLLVMAVLGMLPGASPVVGVLLLFPAWQLMRAHETPILPGVVARRRLSGEQVRRVGRRLRWPLRKLEAVIRPRWPEMFEILRRAVGVSIMLLAPTMLWPFPFSQIPPAIAIMLLAIAHLEEDGVLLIFALAGTLASFAVTAATVWAAIRTTGWLDRLLL